MKKSIILSAIMLVFSTMMNAQTVISSQSLVEDGERVVVSFEVETDVKSIPANRKEIIMPFIYNAKDTLWLETRRSTEREDSRERCRRIILQERKTGSSPRIR